MDFWFYFPYLRLHLRCFRIVWKTQPPKSFTQMLLWSLPNICQDIFRRTSLFRISMRSWMECRSTLLQTCGSWNPTEHWSRLLFYPDNLLLLRRSKSLIRRKTEAIPIKSVIITVILTKIWSQSSHQWQTAILWRDTYSSISLFPTWMKNVRHFYYRCILLLLSSIFCHFPFWRHFNSSSIALFGKSQRRRSNMPPAIWSMRYQSLHRMRLDICPLR